MNLLLISVGLLHGDMSQIERNEVITSFKKKEVPILVATDVAGIYRERERVRDVKYGHRERQTETEIIHEDRNANNFNVSW